MKYRQKPDWLGVMLGAETSTQVSDMKGRGTNIPASIASSLSELHREAGIGGRVGT